MLAVFAAMGLPASLAVPRLTARVRSALGLVAAFAACFAAGLVGLALAPAPATLLRVLVAGWGSGLFPLSLTLVNLWTRTPAGAGASPGSPTARSATSSRAQGPSSPAPFTPRRGAWTLPFLLAAAAMVAVVAGAWLAGNGRLVDDDLDGANARARTVTLDG